jgi:hypothetical protein
VSSDPVDEAPEKRAREAERGALLPEADHRSLIVSSEVKGEHVLAVGGEAQVISTKP